MIYLIVGIVFCLIMIYIGIKTGDWIYNTTVKPKIDIDEYEWYASEMNKLLEKYNIGVDSLIDERKLHD